MHTVSEDYHAVADRPLGRWLFLLMVGAAALFIAGCSAFFSVSGLGLLFVGSATAVMIMAASLEAGKLVAASFLYRYWSAISIPLRLYLGIAVLVLIGITSLGNYGYLARAYEQTNLQVSLLEDQIAAIQREIDDTQAQIDGSKNRLVKVSDAGREDIRQLQQRILEANQLMDGSLARLEERRKLAKDKRDRDMELCNMRLAEVAGVLKKGLDSEDAAIAKLNEQVAALDRAVDAYTNQGGPGFLKHDGVRKGQALREQQKPQREAIAAELSLRRQTQERLRADHARAVEAIGQEAAGVAEQFRAESKALDTEEQQLRKTRADAVASAEKQLAAMQKQGQLAASEGGVQIESLYGRVRQGNEEIRRLKAEIAGTDIGSYRFVARAFGAPADDVVKWLILLLVLVFDPLAVALTVGFNAAWMRDRPLARSLEIAPLADAPVRWRWAAKAAIACLAIAAIVGAAAGVYAGWGLLTGHGRSDHARLVPADSFAVVTLRPGELRKSAADAKVMEMLHGVVGGALSDEMILSLTSGLDSEAPVYAFAKHPSGREGETNDRPTMLVGLVARVGDRAAAEAALAGLGEALAGSKSPRALQMVRYGQGRYMDPQGGFYTFALTDHEAIVMVEVEGDGKRPAIESEMRLCLAETGGKQSASKARPTLPHRAMEGRGAVSLWFDAQRCFSRMPKNAAAQARYQQLQQHLAFDLLLSVAAGSDGKLSLVGDYTYQGQRFGGDGTAPVLAVLSKLGPVDQAGIAGRLMDRCAVTLDYDALIGQLERSLGRAGGGATQVLVEKSISSQREGRFVMVARYGTQAGPPLAAALADLVQ